MTTREIIRAWKDAKYRLSLSEEQRAQLPENPAGLIELRDEDLGAVAGGTWTDTLGCGAAPCTIRKCGNSDSGPPYCY